MKKLGLVLAMGLSMFLVGCEEESSSASKVVSCNQPTQKVCAELEASSVSDEKKAECTSDGGELGTGCAGGSVLSCEVTEDGMKGDIHFYDEAMVTMIKTLSGASSDADFCAAVNEEE
jgi:hypothetical protein